MSRERLNMAGTDLISRQAAIDATWEEPWRGDSICK